MCIGWPMQVESCTPGHALCRRGAHRETIRTDLVGPLQPGDWVLTFLGSAREVLSAGRAHEIESTLALLAQVMPQQHQAVASLGTDPSAADPTAAADPAAMAVAFALPSQMDPAQLRALTGQTHDA